MARYRVLTGIDYPPNKRAEAGDLVDDLPPTSVKWLLEVGAIEETGKDAKKAKAEPTPEPVAEPEAAPVVEPVEAPAETPAADGFDPNATDGDGDGFLQDGTPWQRPVEEK